MNSLAELIYNGEEIRLKGIIRKKANERNTKLWPEIDIAQGMSCVMFVI